MKETKLAALREIERWLPGELAYSAAKAPYEKKVERAALPLSDSRSIYGFLGQEWTVFRRMADAGHHHSDQEGVKTGQQQLAKFYSGLMDKAALGFWLKQGRPVTDSELQAAQHQAISDSYKKPPHSIHRGMNDADYEAVLDQNFEDTLFAKLYIPNIMETITCATAAHTPQTRKFAAIEVIDTALDASQMALKCYLAYAALHLESDQLALPVSRLETPK